jgi:hypothetical protein
MDELLYADPISTAGQALRFPTSRMRNTSGTLVIPDRVKRAQTYLAMHLMEDPDLIAGDMGTRQVSVTGGFSITTKEDTSSGPLDYPLPNDVLSLLTRYLYTGGPIGRVQWDSAKRGWI